MLLTILVFLLLLFHLLLRVLKNPKKDNKRIDTSTLEYSTTNKYKTTHQNETT